METQFLQLSRSKFSFLTIVAVGVTLVVLPSHAQLNPSSTASSAANAAGTTVNNQSNAQINTNTFYGFGPGINCPTPALSVSGFGGSGSGSSAGDSIGAGVSSDNKGAIISFTMPLGGANGEICKEIGKAQVQALLSQVNRANVEATKTAADISLVTALKCVEIQRVAELRGPFASVCAGVYARGVLQAPPNMPGNGNGSGSILNRFQSSGQEQSRPPVAQVESPVPVSIASVAHKTQSKPALIDPIETPKTEDIKPVAPKFAAEKLDQAPLQSASTTVAIMIIPQKTSIPLSSSVDRVEPKSVTSNFQQLWVGSNFKQLSALPPLDQTVLQTAKKQTMVANFQSQ